ncbi:MAG: glycosyltransferase family 2 protein [Nanoarchaeota archaeon]|nr:glycosyltransferase family 2 protein [Nanoarchaeota archaeon]
MRPRVLVGCPTYKKQEYCLSQLVEALSSLTYPELDILFVDNSEGNEYLERLKKIKIPNRKVEVIKDTYSDIRISRIISSRNIVRDHFLKGNYDYLFFLDTDIIPPKDAIEQLIRADTDIASGVYLCRQKIEGEHHVQPVIYKPHGEDSVMTVTKEEVIPNKLMAIAVCGMGCCLIRRTVLAEIKFRPFSQSKTGGEDVAFCTDARQKGLKIIANTEVKCEHMGEMETLSFKPDISYSVSVGE